MLMIHPIEYLKGIKEKIKVNVWIKYYHWINPINREKAREFVHEISLTVDKQVEWSWNKELHNYYIKRLKILESQLQKMFSSDAMEKVVLT